MVSKRLHHLVSGFTTVNESIATTRIRAKFYNISLICAHKPRKGDVVKDAFCGKLEVKEAIMRLKNNKAAVPDGLPAELFKIGCNVMVGCMQQIIYKIWPEENMPSDWNLSV